MLRKQVHFAVITFIILCVGLSIAHLAFGVSLPPVAQQSPVVLSFTTAPGDSKPPFWFSAFLLIVSLTVLIGGVYMFYVAWFQDPDKVRENLQRNSERLSYMRHGYVIPANGNVLLWGYRILSPIMVLFGLFLLWVTLTAF